MPNAAGLACPLCPGSVMLWAESGRIGCSNGHSWNDTGTLLSLSPKSLPLPKKAASIPEGARTLTILLPGRLADAVQARFADRLDSSLTSILQTLLDDGAFVVDGMTAAHLSEQLGDKVTNSMRLKGMVIQMKQELDELKAKLENAKSSGARGYTPPEGSIVVTVNESCMAVLKQQSESQEKPISEVASDWLVFANDNEWIK